MFMICDNIFTRKFHRMHSYSAILCNNSPISVFSYAYYASVGMQVNPILLCVLRVLTRQLVIINLIWETKRCAIGYPNFLTFPKIYSPIFWRHKEFCQVPGARYLVLLWQVPKIFFIFIFQIGMYHISLESLGIVDQFSEKIIVLDLFLQKIWLF